jgi:ATP-dependent RNA helicase DeaD
MAWFRMSVGRRNNADPRWLVPIICRLGHVTKKEIGSIRIFDRETKFEIAEAIAGRFAAAVRRATPNDEDIRIEPAGTPDRGGGKRLGKPPHRGSGPQAHDGGAKRPAAHAGGRPGSRDARGPKPPHRPDAGESKGRARIRPVQRRQDHRRGSAKGKRGPGAERD